MRTTLSAGKGRDLAGRNERRKGKNPVKWGFWGGAGEGFEPSLTDPESVVLTNLKPALRRTYFLCASTDCSWPCPSFMAFSGLPQPESNERANHPGHDEPPRLKRRTGAVPAILLHPSTHGRRRPDPHGALALGGAGRKGRNPPHIGPDVTPPRCRRRPSKRSFRTTVYTTHGMGTGRARAGLPRSMARRNPRLHGLNGTQRGL